MKKRRQRKRVARPTPAWRELADRGELGAWLARHKGSPAWMCIYFLVLDLKTATTEAQRLEIAEALGHLESPVRDLEVRPLKGKAGRKDEFMTWRDAALVNALMKYHGAEQADAVKAVVRMRGWGANGRPRIERYLRDERAGDTINYSHSPAELLRAADLLPKGVHRIK